MRLTRGRLYLWLNEEPATTVARKLGVSSSALKKTCKSHSIPTPSRGHWRKREVGEASARQPLSNPDQDEELPYEIDTDTAMMLQRLEETGEWKAESCDANSASEVPGVAGQLTGEEPAEPRSHSDRRAHEPSVAQAAPSAPVPQRPSSDAPTPDRQMVVSLARRHRELGDALSFLELLECELPSCDPATQAVARLWMERAKASLSRLSPMSEVMAHCREVAHGSAVPTWLK